MGQYHRCVCPTLAEFIDNYQVGSGLKAWEQVAGTTGNALAILLALDPGNAPGDLASPVTGRWAGHPVAMIGDYAENGDIPGWRWEPEGDVYGLCMRDEAEECHARHLMRGETQEAADAERRRDYERQLAEIQAAGHRVYTTPGGSMRELQGMLEYALNVRFCGDGWLNAVRVRAVATARHVEDYRPAEMRVCEKGWANKSGKYQFATKRFDKIGVYELVGARVESPMSMDILVSPAGVETDVKRRRTPATTYDAPDDETLAYYARCGIKVDDWHRPPRSGHWHGLRDAEIEEGQSRVIANLDRREYIDPLAFGEADTIAGIVTGDNGSAAALLAMLCEPTRRGGGDLAEHELVGQWRADRLVITSERSRALIPETEELFPTTAEVRAGFRDLSYGATAMIHRVVGS